MTSLIDLLSCSMYGLLWVTWHKCDPFISITVVIHIKTRIDLNHLLKLGGHHTSSVYWREECFFDFIFSLQYMEHLQQAIQVAPHTFWDEMWLKAILSWIFTSHCVLGQNTCEYRPGRGRDFHLLPSPADYLDVTLGPLSCTACSTKRPLLAEQILSSQSTRHKNRIVSS